VNGDGSPATPAERAVAASMLASSRAELGLLVGAGAARLVPAFASAVIGEALLGATPGTDDGAVTVQAVEADGQIFVIASRAGRPFFALALGDSEASRLAMQISEILNRRKG
jgi:hypothetical protein